jgi:hypothetical protein
VKGRVVIAVVGICALLVGCGGAGSSMSKEDVQQQGWEWIRGQTTAKTLVDDPGCVDDGDVGHWRCVTDVHATPGATVHITFTATCDAESCLYELVSAS